MNQCIQCHAVSPLILLWRPRPMKNGEYAICLTCARAVRADHSERDLTVSSSESRTDAGRMLAGINKPYSPDRENGVAGKLAGRGRGNP